VTVIYGPWEGDADPTTLEDCVKQECDLWAFCRSCGHAARVSTKTLVLRLGFVSLRAAARRMHCVRCHGRQSVLMAGDKWPKR
jgi:hypothetical protein